MIKDILALDPSINRTGIVFLNFNGEILSIGSIRTKGSTLPEKVCSLCDELDHRIALSMTTSNTLHVIIEQPEKQVSLKGTTSYERNDFVKLCTAFGALLAMVFQLGIPSDRIYLMTPSQWKGQVPKAITKKRMQTAFPELNINELNHDEIDALALAKVLYENLKSISSGKAT